MRYVINPPPPFISQIEPNGLGMNNCGPAVAAMQLAHRGVIAGTQGAMHYVADIVRDGVPNDLGTWWNTYTTFTQLINCAGWFGIDTVWCDTWAEVKASIQADESVCLLVYNGVLQPRLYPATAAFNANHFIMIYGFDEEAGEWYVGDPLRTYDPRTHGVYSNASILEATRRVGGIQAYGFTPVDKPVEDDEMALTDNERAALAQLRALGWGADSIVNAVNHIGALEAVVGQVTGERDNLKGLFEERGHQVVNLETEVLGLNATVQALREQIAVGDPAKYELTDAHLIWKDGVERMYVLQDVTHLATVSKPRAVRRKK